MDRSLVNGFVMLLAPFAKDSVRSSRGVPTLEYLMPSSSHRLMTDSPEGLPELRKVDRDVIG